MIMIGIPSKGDVCTGLVAWLIGMKENYSLMMNESRWVSNARNMLTTIACETSEIDELLFIDSDCFPPIDSPILSQLRGCMKLNKADIVCVPYYMQPRYIKGQPVFNMITVPRGVQTKLSAEELVKPHQLEGWAPFGFSLMKVEFLRRVWKEKFNSVTTAEASTELEVPTFWGVNMCTHEDKHFGELMMEFSAKMWLYPKTKVYHALERVIL